jgi:hypothetical protein
MNRPAIEIDVAVYGIIMGIGKPIRIPYKPFPFIFNGDEHQMCFYINIFINRIKNIYVFNWLK